MSSLKDVPDQYKKKILKNLSKEEKDMLLDILAKYILSLEEREKRLKELVKL